MIMLVHVNDIVNMKKGGIDLFVELINYNKLYKLEIKHEYRT